MTTWKGKYRSTKKRNSYFHCDFILGSLAFHASMLSFIGSYLFSSPLPPLCRNDLKIKFHSVDSKLTLLIAVSILCPISSSAILRPSLTYFTRWCFKLVSFPGTSSRPSRDSVAGKYASRSESSILELATLHNGGYHGKECSVPGGRSISCPRYKCTLQINTETLLTFITHRAKIYYIHNIHCLQKKIGMKIRMTLIFKQSGGLQKDCIYI